MACAEHDIAYRNVSLMSCGLAGPVYNGGAVGGNELQAAHKLTHPLQATLRMTWWAKQQAVETECDACDNVEFVHQLRLFIGDTELNASQFSVGKSHEEISWLLHQSVNT